MIIAISGSVGSGKTTITKAILEYLNNSNKTTIANVFSNKLNFKYVPLNDIANNFKLFDVKELQTFDFDIAKLLNFIEKDIKLYINEGKNVILESHFSHFINPDLVDVLFVISRDLKKLKLEYNKRGYNKKKQEDNLEVESFNLCFYEAIEEGYNENGEWGYEDGKKKTPVFLIENDDDIEEVVDKIIRKIKKIKEL